MASATTAIAGFAVLVVSDIRMLRDFGLVTLIDLTVSLLGVLVVLPAALLLAERGVRVPRLVPLRRARRGALRPRERPARLRPARRRRARNRARPAARAAHGAAAAGAASGDRLLRVAVGVLVVVILAYILINTLRTEHHGPGGPTPGSPVVPGFAAPLRAERAGRVRPTTARCTCATRSTSATSTNGAGRARLPVHARREVQRILRRDAAPERRQCRAWGSSA